MRRTIIITGMLLAGTLFAPAASHATTWTGSWACTYQANRTPVQPATGYRVRGPVLCTPFNQNCGGCTDPTPRQFFGTITFTGHSGGPLAVGCPGRDSSGRAVIRSQSTTMDPIAVDYRMVGSDVAGLALTGGPWVGAGATDLKMTDACDVSQLDGALNLNGAGTDLLP